MPWLVITWPHFLNHPSFFDKNSLPCFAGSRWRLCFTALCEAANRCNFLSFHNMDQLYSETLPYARLCIGMQRSRCVTRMLWNHDVEIFNMFRIRFYPSKFFAHFYALHSKCITRSHQIPSHQIPSSPRIPKRILKKVWLEKNRDWNDIEMMDGPGWT